MRFPRLAMLITAGLFALPAPLLAQTPPAQPTPPPPAQAPQPKPGDPFGEEVTLTAKTIVFSKG